MIDNHYAWDFAEKMICEAVDVAEADGTHFSYMEVLNMVPVSYTHLDVYKRQNISIKQVIST